MSVRHIAGVLDLSLRPGPKLIALVYANSANDEDDLAWLSVESVAARSGYSERQAQTLIRQLAALGVLETVPLSALPDGAAVRSRGIPRNRMPTVYRLHYSGVQSSHLTPGSGVQSARSRGAVRRDSGVKPTAPKPEEGEPEVNLWARDIRYKPIGEPTSTPHVWQVNGHKVDLLWDTLVEIGGLDTSQLTADSRGSLNRSVKQLRAVGADPPEIRKRAKRYRSGSGPIPQGAKLTHRALVSHWPELGTPDISPVQVGPPHVHEWMPHFRVAGREVCSCGEKKEAG